ncbi:MAG: deoxyribose-phosphate aldolase [Saccharofermentanales bacterium]
MDIKRILAATDHTLLAQTSTLKEIHAICDEAIGYGTASICIPPFYVAAAASYCAGRMPVCTVIGFPNGYATTATKIFETKDAIAGGADEIDMVIPVGALKDRRYREILHEITAIKAACGSRILKVIIETCLLTDDEKMRMCEIVTDAKADFIKTSTGFSTGGATADDLRLFKQYLGPHVRIKAAGGIKSLEIAEEFMNIGASRLGSSSIIKMVKAYNLESGASPTSAGY